MSTQRFTSEFKAEAIRQVIERGYSVADIAERLGVSSVSTFRGRTCSLESRSARRVIFSSA